MADKRLLRPNAFPTMIAKLDRKRCCVRLSDLKWRKSTLPVANKYTLTVNQAWDDVISGIWNKHGIDWVFEPLANGYKAMRPPSPYQTKLYSFELWCDGQLAAGELGYVCGTNYTSLSGYYESQFPGAGRVQLTALGCLLKVCGFQLWDFGMFMEYKVSYGASKFPRDQFFSEFATNLQQSPVAIEQYLAEHNTNARAIIEAAKALP